MARRPIVLGGVALASAWGASGLTVALYGSGVSFVLAGLLAALPAGLLTGIAARALR